MVDRFLIDREQKHKEWWRERRIAPATFFGFPDVTKHGLRGGSLYIEQMDSVTLAVLADKCLKEKIWDPEIWTKFSWRAQQIVTRTHEPDLCYIFRAFARADWFDQNLLTTYLGRLHRRLSSFSLPDVAVLLEAFANPRFRQSTYLQKALVHLVLLLQHRDDAKTEDLARSCAALKALRPLQSDLAREVLVALELLAEGLLLRELAELSPSRVVLVLDCYVSWGLVARETGQERRTASTDVCWALVRQLKGQLHAHGKEHPEDLASLAFTMAAGGLEHEELWEELAEGLEQGAHLLSGPATASAAYGLVRSGRPYPQLLEVLARRLGEQRATLSPMDCSRAAGGFLRGPAALAENAVLRGPVFDRILEIGLDKFDGEALSLLFDALSRARRGATGVESMAGAILETMHPSLADYSARELASVVRSLGHLRPDAPDVLCAVLDHAHDAAIAAWERKPEDGYSGVGGLGGFAPRHVAMMCQGIAVQSEASVPDVPLRLARLLPLTTAALAAARPTAISATQLLGAFKRCPPSPGRDSVLDTSAERLLSGARELPAQLLVTLTTSLAELKQTGWTPSAALLREVTQQLDTKRYDLAPGVLWRAARALEDLNDVYGVALRLESRDKPKPAIA